MIKRAILWCGQVARRRYRRDKLGRLRDDGDPLSATYDLKIQANGLELAFQGALALGVPREEVYAFVRSDDLLPQAFRGTSHAATVPDLQRAINGIADRAAPDDPLLFIAVNHGTADGLLTADASLEELDDDAGPRLTPQVLEDCLHALAGPQILVIAACFAGVFLPLGNDARAVLACCAAGERYRIHREDCAWSAFLDELFGAWCAVSFSDAIPRDRLPLDAAFARAHERLVAARAPNLPHRAGVAAWPA